MGNHTAVHPNTDPLQWRQQLTRVAVPNVLGYPRSQPVACLFGLGDNLPLLSLSLSLSLLHTHTLSLSLSLSRSLMICRVRLSSAIGIHQSVLLSLVCGSDQGTHTHTHARTHAHTRLILCAYFWCFTFFTVLLSSDERQV